MVSCPMREDVKKKILAPPLRGDVDVVTCIQPVSFLEGFLVWPLGMAAHSSGDPNPSCLSQIDGFMKRWRSTPFGSEATQAKRWLKCQP